MNVSSLPRKRDVNVATTPYGLGLSRGRPVRPGGAPMNTLQRNPAPAPGHDADPLIWEAQRRQQRRHLVAGLTVIAVLATTVAAAHPD